MPLRALLAALTLTLLGGCYVLASAKGQLELNTRRVPVATLLARPDTPERLRHWLEVATKVRDFASAELGLPDNKSYRSYADVGRRYVVWNVFAAPEFSVEAKTWCFPVAGCVAYRGYFAEPPARRFAQGLEAKGFDAMVAGVAAYSTLGHFDDPVLNTMLDWDDVELAALLFHELAHQLLYVKNDTEFNESFASVVENEGVRRWLAHEGRSAALAGFLEREARYRGVATLLGDARARLHELYAQALPAAQLREGKRAEFERLRQAYHERRNELGSGYDWMFGPALNNATLVSVGTYQDCAPGLEARLRASSSLEGFYAGVRALARLSMSERHRAVCGPSAVAPPTVAP